MGQKEFQYKSNKIDGLNFLQQKVEEGSPACFDLTNKTLEYKTFEEILDDGWRVTKKKLEADLVQTETL